MKSNQNHSALPVAPNRMQRWLQHAGFTSHQQFAGFLSVVLAGQLIYSSFEAFKGTFYDLLLQTLHINNTQLGTLFSLIGISLFFYVPAGWINNRFSIRSILVTGILIRFVTIGIIVLFPLNFFGLEVIATIWGLVEAVFWPAILNGVALFSTKERSGLAFGLLESIRRALEVVMNLVLVAVMAVFGGVSVFKGGMFVYNLLLIPLVVVIWRKVPANGIGAQTTTATSKAKDAFHGLIKVLLMPQVWLASLTAMTVYWSYINLIYTVPYLQAVFKVGQMQASLFGVINTGAMGIVAGVLSGALADFIFKSPTKMIPAALALVAVALIAVVLLPVHQSLLLVNIGLLLIFSFATFLVKSIMLAPLTEAAVPEKYFGAASSVGSFLAYAPVFWAYSLNGFIIDAAASPAAAYRTIFTISAAVACGGVASALGLWYLSAKQNSLQNNQ